MKQVYKLQSNPNSIDCGVDWTRVQQAEAFAHRKHEEVKQRRKYTGLPYIVHPERVATLVSLVPHTTEMLMAAWLHDTVEDTNTTLQEIKEHFGSEVMGLVDMLTDVSKPSDGNREVRKGIDHRHIANASVEAKTIKLADLIDNSRCITRHDPAFAKVYLREKALMLEVLTEGDEALWNWASQFVAAR